jgi:hypothetical protein
MKSISTPIDLYNFSLTSIKSRETHTRKRDRLRVSISRLSIFIPASQWSRVVDDMADLDKLPFGERIDELSFV